MKFFTMVLIATLLVGCGVTRGTKESVGTSGVNAPANQSVAEREVTYCDTGMKVLRDQRRKTAFEKMAGDCPAGYNIDDEYVAEGAVCSTQRTIRFSCVAP